MVIIEAWEADVWGVNAGEDGIWGPLGRFPGQVVGSRLTSFLLPPRLSAPTKSSQPSFKVKGRFCFKKLARRSSHNTTKTLVWALRHPRRPLRAPILINAPLLVMSSSKGRFCLVL